MASPQDVKRLETQNGLDAQAEYKLANAVSLLLSDAAIDSEAKADIASDLWDGPESVYGQLNAIDPVAFPVPPRPV